jgi:hypothetical protein
MANGSGNSPLLRIGWVGYRLFGFSAIIVFSSIQVRNLSGTGSDEAKAVAGRVLLLVLVFIVQLCHSLFSIR